MMSKEYKDKLTILKDIKQLEMIREIEIEQIKELGKKSQKNRK